MLVRINGNEEEVPEGTSIAELLAQLGVKAQHVAVEVNLELVPRERHGQHRLAAGDQLEIVTLVGGG